MSAYLSKLVKTRNLIILCIVIAFSQVLRGILRLADDESLDLLIETSPIPILILFIFIIYLGINPIVNSFTHLQVGIDPAVEAVISAFIQMSYAIILMTVAYGGYKSSDNILKLGFYFFIFATSLSSIGVFMTLFNIFDEGTFIVLTNACVMAMGAYLTYNIKHGKYIDPDKNSSSENDLTNPETESNPSQTSNETQNVQNTQNIESQSAENEAAIYTLLNYVGVPQKKLIAAIGAVLIAVGALLPWISVSIFDLTRRGIDADGTITFAGSLIILVLVLFTKWGRKNRLLSLVIGVLVALISLLYIIDPLFGVQVPDEDIARGVIDIGSGLYVTLLGSILVVFSTIESVYK